MLTIYLVRHGESLLNAGGEEAKHIPDHALPLTEKGKQQALEAGEVLLEEIQKGLRTEKWRMWVSPYKRTRETAELINKTLQLKPNDIKEDSMLVEMDFGLFDGLSKAEMQEMYPVEWAKFQKDKLEKGKFFARRPGGESALDVEMRVRLFLDTIFRDYNSGGPDNLIVVCHGALINVFLKAFLHKSHEWYYEQGNPSNCSIIKIRRHGGGVLSTWQYIHGGAEEE